MLRSGFQAGLRVASRRNNVGALRHMSKEIKFGVEGRNAMLVGVNTLADAVQVRQDFFLRNSSLRCFVVREARVTCTLRQESRSEKIPFLRGFVSAKRNLRNDLHKNNENPAPILKFTTKNIPKFTYNSPPIHTFLFYYCNSLSITPLPSYLSTNQTIGHSRTQGPKCHHRSAIRSTKNYQGWCDSRQVHRFRGSL